MPGDNRYSKRLSRLFALLRDYLYLLLVMIYFIDLHVERFPGW